MCLSIFQHIFNYRLRAFPFLMTRGSIPVAEEAAQTAEYFGTKVDRIYDVGVAGIHRLLSQRERISKANCIIAVAGMEGLLEL